MGHLGKQLLSSLLEKTQITASNIKVSTTRPECSGNVEPGVECFFDNGRLAQWADVLFLCCLPSQLPTVCADLSPHLCRHTLVYSFPSAVPISRLVQLLEHNFVLKSQYDADACDNPEVWRSCTHLNTALKDPLLLKLSCPLRLTGKQHKPSLGLKWMCAVLYSLVNICMAVHLEWKETLHVMNQLFKDKLSQSLEMNAQNVISSSTSCMSADDVFSWISVSDAQTKETPLYSFYQTVKPHKKVLLHCTLHFW
uniref:Pyrroline-5-carboxylate reductase catalytic N-terminal domain-containing protein n=1 Tax=Neogobius melanostomus TaxID=47308 RepID=A0A8C6T034_9GOBI